MAVWRADACGVGGVRSRLKELDGLAVWLVGVVRWRLGGLAVGWVGGLAR